MAEGKPVYEILFRNRKLASEYEELLGSLGPTDRGDFEEALRQLRSNPYPQPTTPRGTIRKVGQAWRYKVNYSYRIVYEIRGQRVIIRSAGHRKDIYRDL